jgi:hypothetical protein
VLHVRTRSGRVIDTVTASPTAAVSVWTPDDLRARLAAGAADADPDIEVRVTPLPTDGTEPPVAPGIPETGGNDMPDKPDSRPTGGVPAVRRARSAADGSDTSVAWKSLANVTGDFQPEDDADLLAWMAGEAGGMSLYAEAIQDAYETAVNTVGLDPAAMRALHDYADAAAQGAEAMAAARQRFADHYKEVREFTAAGGVLPYDGRWMTGEGD